MAQVTKNTIHYILAYAAQGKHFPLTVNELQQLAYLAGRQLASPAKVGGDEREAFEAAYHAVFPARPLLIPSVLSRDGNAYQHPNVDGCWKLWRQARALGAYDYEPFDWLETEISAVSCWYHGTPSYEHDANWMKEQALQLVKEASVIFGDKRAALSADGGDRKDAERLDFMIEQQAWVQWTVRDGSIRQCQVYTQDEDENYHILSGEDRFFSTPREAIDAAIAAKAKGEAK